MRLFSRRQCFILPPHLAFRFQIFSNILGLWILFSGFSVHAKEETFHECTRLFRQKKLHPAALCFLRAADELGESSKIKPIERFKKGRLLLNAARLYIRAAKQSKQQDLKNRDINFAIKLFDRYLQEALFENAPRQRSIQNERYRLLKRSLFSKLTLHSYEPKALLCVQNSTTPKQCIHAYSWSLYLPAGTYQTSVTYPLSVPFYRRIKLVALESYNQGFSPPTSESLVDIHTEDPKTVLFLRSVVIPEAIRFEGKHWTLKLPPGPYSLEIRYPNALPFQRNFTVSVAEKLKLSYPRPTAKLTLTSNPSQAQVFFEEVYSGTTPITIYLPDGDILLHLRSFCHRVLLRKLSLEANSTQKIHFDLTPEPQHLRWQKEHASLPTKRAVGWSLLIGGIILSGIATGGYIAGNMGYNDVSQKLLGPSSQQAQDANMWMLTGHITAPLGALGIGFGAYQLAQAYAALPYASGCENGASLLQRKKL